MILLNPGPVTLSHRVRNAMLCGDICHREHEFADLTLNVRERLERVYPGSADTHTAVLLTGSGTAAVEAMLISMLPPSARTLVVANGVYGERIIEVLTRHRRPHTAIATSWTEPLPLDSIADVLANTSGIDYVAAVHHETTTGRLNDIEALGRLCQAHRIGLLVDAVSSFGAEELRLVEWNIVAAAATANKCLHGVPGISFVIAAREALAACAGNADSLYLDLDVYFRQQFSGWSPFTQAVQPMCALSEALCEFAEAGGWHARRHRYRQLSDRLRATLPQLGANCLLRPDESASMLTAFRLPKDMSYEHLHDHLKAAGFVIYAGQGPLARDIFRIATMGAIGDDDLDRLLATFATLMV